jgi:virulence-associated protein VagC
MESRRESMKQSGRAKIFRYRGRQAVLLPKWLSLPGKQLRVSRSEDHVLLEPIRQPKRVDWKALFAAMNAIDAPPLKRPRQLKTPIRKIFD